MRRRRSARSVDAFRFDDTNLLHMMLAGRMSDEAEDLDG